MTGFTVEDDGDPMLVPPSVTSRLRTRLRRSRTRGQTHLGHGLKLPLTGARPVHNVLGTEVAYEGASPLVSGEP